MLLQMNFLDHRVYACLSLTYSLFSHYKQILISTALKLLLSSSPVIMQNPVVRSQSLFYLTASQQIIPSLKHSLHKASKTSFSLDFSTIPLVKLSEFLLLDPSHFTVVQILSNLRYNFFSSVALLTFCVIPSSSMVFTNFSTDFYAHKNLRTVSLDGN